MLLLVAPDQFKLCSLEGCTLVTHVHHSQIPDLILDVSISEKSSGSYVVAYGHNYCE